MSAYASDTKFIVAELTHPGQPSFTMFETRKLAVAFYRRRLKTEGSGHEIHIAKLFMPKQPKAGL